MIIILSWLRPVKENIAREYNLFIWELHIMSINILNF